MNYVFLFAIGIGIVAGLRSLLPPAVVAWAAHLGWLNLHGSPLAFMGSTAAVAIFSIFAIGELITDKLQRLQNGPPWHRYWRGSSWAASAARAFARQQENH
jgi:uncharacterized membrane protein